ncbi:MAG: flavodoxin family protein [bacterium]|nr:flavodoxin family protein [bacterium]
MKYAIVINSKTGNTKRLAEAIQETVGKDTPIYEEPVNEAKDADVIFAGFWTDKGSCTGEMKEFLTSLQNKKVFLFGTAGFGGGSEYFTQILGRVKENINLTNQIIGEYMCQGKMPMGIRARYEAMAAENPENEKFKGMIENFDMALLHPDQEDLQKLKKQVELCIKN